MLAGLQHQVPARHSILLSMAFGPLGLLSNLLTQVCRLSTLLCLPALHET